MPSPAAGDLFSPVRNRGLFSGHWLEHRLELEPEWTERPEDAGGALAALGVLWKKERNRVEKYGDEQGLEEAFIQPVFKALGWTLKYQTFLQDRKPDYALFADDAALDAALAVDRTAAEFWHPAAAVADAKRWDTPLDKKVGSGARKEYPPEQIEWYLDRSRKDFGVLTNGRLWRLVPREIAPHQRRFQTYYEVDLPAILDAAITRGPLDHHVTEDFRRFYLFFGPAGHAAVDGRKPLVRRAVEGSTEYRQGVSEGLKGQAFESLRVAIEGFLAHAPNKLDPDHDLGRCREAGFILLCRLLFVMFAEDRRLLPYKVNPTYTNNRSLGRVRDDITDRLDKARGKRGDDYSRTDTGLWDYLTDLFDLIDRGHGTYKVPAYNGGLFAADAHPFLTERKLADWHLARVVDGLGRAPDPTGTHDGLFRVDYRDLAIQHLGGIYEGLLEQQPVRAAVRVAVYTRRAKGVVEERYVTDAEPRPDGFTRTATEYGPGSVYLVKNKNERRTFGSYYTPDPIVRHIVKAALAPLCREVADGIISEVEAAAAGGAPPAVLDRLRDSYPDRVLALRVLDPAMGSGHFLLAACQYLAEEIATHPFTPAGPAEAGPGDDALAYWKRAVVESCLYGVDLNPLAVDLAKLALWLETVARDRPLTFLDHHLRHGNSLIGGRLADLASPGGTGGLVGKMFDAAFRKKLPGLLRPLADIRGLPSDTAKAVKEKGAKFAAYARAADPLVRLAHLWAADAAGHTVPVAKYTEAAEAVDRPRAFDALAGEDWFAAAAAYAADGLAAFHWDLAFPEVFADDAGPRAAGGFDAVVGNPPYEVLSQKESGADPSALKAVANTVPALRPAVRGKQNLYKLFVCRAADVLRDGGRLGFITPMAVLGDDQAVGVRKLLIGAGRFAGVDAFPQKDSVPNRVFADAKLSTAVFAWVKGAAGAGGRFPSRVWPANTFDADPLGNVELETADIPLYDPENLTVVSCDQADWDVAVSLMKSGRMVRLNRYAAFYQGEVNETNARAAGHLAKPGEGKLVTRGASICLYVARPASQGEDLYLNVAEFLREADPGAKAHHSKYPRVAVQESSPQNNFRRIIAASVPAGEYCNHTINYLPEHTSRLPLEFVLGLLNTELADWYFRLGSTNAHVSQYQLGNLPCPHFGAEVTDADRATADAAVAELAAGRPAAALSAAGPLLETAPFSPAVQDVVVAAVGQIVAAEAKRGEMTRSDRSALSSAAQPYQDFLDAVFFRLAGLTDEEVAGLRDRYERMKKVK